MNTPTSFKADIIVPVWNRPIETRDCLVRLIEHSPDARIMLVDNGSDREMEQILEEFADRLADRALLLKSQTNIGFVRAVNMGLNRGESDCLVVVRNTSKVSAGWLEPMLELAASRPEAGIIVPPLVLGTGRKAENRTHADAVIEVSCGSFAAMLVTRPVRDLVGGFDEGLDGDQWCLRDYSRRALAAGFHTLGTAGGAVTYCDEVHYGSVKRREETVQQSRAEFESRWGIDGEFCVYFPKDADQEVVRDKFALLLAAARQGDRFTVAVHGDLYRALVSSGDHAQHRNISLEKLPRLFALSALNKIYGRVLAANSETMAISGIDGLPFPGVTDYAPFSYLEEKIARRTARSSANFYNPGDSL